MIEISSVCVPTPVIRRHSIEFDADGDHVVEPERIQTSPSHLLKDSKLMGMRDTIDAIVSAGGLHWIGDIVGSLTQVKHLLKPDGVFVGAVIGGDSLFELRSAHNCHIVGC